MSPSAMTQGFQIGNKLGGTADRGWLEEKCLNHNMKCKKCGCRRMKKNGHTGEGRIIFRCFKCGGYQTITQ